MKYLNTIRMLIASLAFTPIVATQQLTKRAILWKVVSKNIQRSQITAMAAALSFRTIFGLIPVMVVSLVVLHRFVPETKVKEVVTNFLDYTGLTKIVVEEPQDNTSQQALQQVPGINIFNFGFGGLTPHQTFQASSRDGSEVAVSASGVEVHASAQADSQTSTETTATPAQAAAQSQRLDDWIAALLGRIDGINFAAIGLVGIVMLLYAALSMIVEIEKAFNQIAEAPSGKSWVKRITHYWTLLTLGPLLLIAGFAVAQGLQPFLVDQLEWLPVSSKLMVDVLGSLIAIPISAIALMILYTSVPNKRIEIRAAFMGGLGAALMWELSKWGLVGYIKYSSSYARLYGVIALLPLFLLWVYITWIIVLLGFQVTTTLQTFRVISRQGFQNSVMIALGLMNDPRGEYANTPGYLRATRVRVLDHSLPLRAMVLIAHRFQTGQQTDILTLSKHLGTDEQLVEGVLAKLLKANLLNRVASDSVDGESQSDARPTNSPATQATTSDTTGLASFALAKPANVILASEVFAAGEEALEGANDKTRITSRLREARLAAFKAVTVADLVAELMPPPPPEQESDRNMPAGARVA
ncbi:MAG: YihY/virulence factor BrkB family protein [Phycisphaerales bacterium]